METRAKLERLAAEAKDAEVGLIVQAQGVKHGFIHEARVFAM